MNIDETIKELIEKFTDENYFSEDEIRNNAIDNAVICVEYLIKFDLYNRNKWQTVKQELESMRL